MGRIPSRSEYRPRLKLKMSTPAAAERAFYQANIRILMEQANLKAAAIREAALSAEVAMLRGLMAEETASREELIFIRHEVGRLKSAAVHEQSPESCVEAVSWRSGTPPRRPLVYINLAHLLTGPKS